VLNFRQLDFATGKNSMTIQSTAPVFFNATWKKALLYAGMLAVGGSRYSHAADFQVTTLADSGAGSLRAAVIAANATLGVADTISFAPNVTGIIPLGSEIQITDSLTITGPGASSLRINAGVSSRHLSAIGIMSPVNLTISGLTFGGGNGINGSSILSTSDSPGGATLTIRNCVLTGNTDLGFMGTSGGAVRTTNSNLIIEDSQLTSNTAVYGGPAIYVSGGGRAIIRRCTVSGNTGTGSQNAGGGAIKILQGSNHEISNSTIANNTLVENGGGVYIANATGTNQIDQCTISNNTTSGNGGGVHSSNTPLSIRSSTIANNTANQQASTGGGIRLMSNTLTLTNTLLSGNVVTNAATPSDISTEMYAVATGTNNLVSSSLGLGTGQLVGNGNLLGTQVAPINALLGPLQNNGGPTQTRLPQTGSPAINAGTTTSAFTTDQRGFARVSGAATDIGSVEVDGTAPTAALTPIANVTDASTATELLFTVVYTDDSAVLRSSLGDTDIRVTGPNSFSALATLVSSTPATDSATITAVYRLVPPGGSWDVGDNGVYSISVEATQVQDVATNSVAAGLLGYAMVGLNGNASTPAVVVTITSGTTVNVAFNFPNPPIIPLTVAVNFGDGTTGVPGPHTYAQPGTYTVTITVTGQGGTPLTFTTSVTVSAASTGGNFRVRVSKIKLNADGSDDVQLQGVISVPSNLTYAGKTIDVNVGGATQTFTLDAAGKGTSATGKIKVNLPKKKKNGIPAAAQEVSFVTTYSGAFAAAIKANAPLDDAGLPTSLPVTVQFNSQTYRQTLKVKFKSGKATTTRFGFF
jgi:parallel beta-helix repeat protein